MSSRVTLSPRQNGIVNFIELYVKTRGYPPTLREIAAGVGLCSTSSVAYQLDALASLGVLRRDRGIERGLVLTMPPHRRMT